MHILNTFDPKYFLDNYWQKQPVLIKNFFPNFVDPLDEHDLAGLAQENDIDARIVSQDKHGWQVHSGPFEEYEPLCQGQWSLLVQSVDRYLDEAAELMDAFDFLPHWRMDDLMVSFSVPGAGVGPHLDQYDVFIIQGKGERHWQVGNKGDYPIHCPHPKLRQVAGFDPIIDAKMQPGDVLYIPPGFPHDGVACIDSLNYSVGFRAPNAIELLNSTLDRPTLPSLFEQRYSDPHIALRQSPEQVNREELARLKQLMIDAIAQEDDHWLLTHLSHSHNDHLYSADNYRQEEIESMFGADIDVYPLPGIRALWIAPDNADAPYLLAIEGQQFVIPANEFPFVQQLLHTKHINLSQSENFSLFFKQFLHKLIASGYWFPDC